MCIWDSSVFQKLLAELNAGNVRAAKSGSREISSIPRRDHLLASNLNVRNATSKLPLSLAIRNVIASQIVNGCEHLTTPVALKFVNAIVLDHVVDHDQSKQSAAIYSMMLCALAQLSFQNCARNAERDADHMHITGAITDHWKSSGYVNPAIRINITKNNPSDSWMRIES